MTGKGSHAETVVPIMKEIGAELKDNFGVAKKVHNKGKWDNDVVTELDIKTEDFIRERLAKEYPDIDFVGEEHGGNAEAERFWLLDPIDGTAHFIRGNPFCTTMLTLIEAGQSTFSAIYDFVRDDMYLAERGSGATKNGQSINVSDRSLEESYLSYEVDFTKGNNVEKWLKLNEKCILMNTINTGYEFALVASGKLEGRICFDAYGDIYDFAPGTLLVEEAGGIVRNLKSDSYDYRNFSFTATNPKVYEELLKGNYL